MAVGHPYSRRRPASLSLGEKVRRLESRLLIDSFSEKDAAFIRSVVRQTDHGRNTTVLSSEQVEWLEDIWERQTR